MYRQNFIKIYYQHQLQHFFLYKSVAFEIFYYKGTELLNEVQNYFSESPNSQTTKIPVSRVSVDSNDPAQIAYNSGYKLPKSLNLLRRLIYSSYQKLLNVSYTYMRRFKCHQKQSFSIYHELLSLSYTFKFILLVTTLQW